MSAIKPIVGIYHPKTFKLIRDISEWVTVDSNFNWAVMGEGEGYIDLELKPDFGLDEFPFSVNQFFENSHYVKVGTSLEVFPGVVKAAEVLNAGSILRIEIIGAMKYFEQVDIVPFYKAGDNSIALSEDDNSLVMNLYANNTISQLENLLVNHTLTMQARGQADFLHYDLESYRSGITQGFTGSYRINGFETPTLAECIKDICGDSEMQLLKISCNQNLNVDFRFTFEIIQALSVKTADFNNNENPYTDISFDSFGREIRTYSIAQGEDLLGRQILERVNYNDSVAYSSIIEDNTSEATDAVRKIAEDNKNNQVNNRGTFSFTSSIDEFELLEYIEVQGLGGFLNFPLSGVVVEKEYAGQFVTYKIQVSPAITENATFTKPGSIERQLIFNKLDNANSLSSKNAKSKGKHFTTGWRQ